MQVLLIECNLLSYYRFIYISTMHAWLGTVGVWYPGFKGEISVVVTNCRLNFVVCKPISHTRARYFSQVHIFYFGIGETKPENWCKWIFHWIEDISSEILKETQSAIKRERVRKMWKNDKKEIKREIETSELSLFRTFDMENKNNNSIIIHRSTHADLCWIHKRHVIWLTNAKTIVKEEKEEEETKLVGKFWL